MARLTLDLDGRLVREAKNAAAERGITLTRLIEHALRDALALATPAMDYAPSWVPVHGVSLPDVDIADRGSLYDLMKDRLSR
jgi:hypothetical protein